MDFRILGSLEVWDGERQLELGGPKRRAVLAFLLLHANEVVSVDRLVDQLWGDKAPRNAAAALHTHVSRLRKELGPDVVATRAWGYVLRSDPGTIDLERFERIVAEADSLPARERAAKLREALADWRGAPLEDLAFEPALAKEIARLEELRLTVLENRIDADLEAGQHSGIVGELEVLIAEHPLRERLRGQLILALYRSGRQAEALEVYRETRRVLAEELGLEPSPELRELERAILQHDPALRTVVHGGKPLAEPGVRPGRRRPLYLGAAIVMLLVGAGAAAYALSSRPAHVAQSSLLPAKHVTHRHAPTRVRTHTVVRRAKPAAPAVTTTARLAKPNKPVVLQRPASRPISPPSPATTATTTPPAKTVTTPPSSQPKPVRIADDFSDPTLDPLIWSSWSEGTGAGVEQTNGQLVFSLAANATFESQFHSVGINVGTKCRFGGDFDARVDFSLLQWPTGNGAAISLVAYQTGPVDEISRTTTSQWGDIYNSWPGQGAVALTDTSGSLRMTRSSGVVKTYIWHHDQWKELSAQPISGAIWVGLSLGSFADRWEQMDVSGGFDNFVLTAPDANCPAGSDPRNP